MQPDFFSTLDSLSIAIIGTAGRGTDEPKLNASVYSSMVETTWGLVQEIAAGRDFELISGGAAYADHIAVDLFLQKRAKGLTIHMPCEWNTTIPAYKDTGVFDWKSNPGGTSNHFHRKFSRAIGRNSLIDINTAIFNGATTHIGSGFHHRNSAVSKATAVIALTFGAGALLKDGGTADTMKKYLALHADNDLSYHVDLNTMSSYKGAKV